MSIRAILKGVETRLRSEDVLNDSPEQAVGRYVGIQPAPGMPPPNFGQYYVAIHWGGGRGADKLPERHDVYHGVVCTLTARLNYAPGDRHAIRLTTVDDIYDLVDQIAGPNIIHGNWATITYANEFIEGTAEYVAIQGGTATVNGFVEPLILTSFGPERSASAEWISAAKTPKDVYIIDIRFAEARRLRVYSG